jgi:hypothetical protein
MASGAFICGTRQLAGKTNTAKVLCQQLLDHGVTLHILDASQAWNKFSISNIVGFAPDFTTLNVDFAKNTVYDMSAVGHKDRIAIANQVCRNVLQLHVQRGYTAPMAVIFEECQTYMYNGCMRSLTLFEPIIDYITIGGNYNTSFMAITQFPAMVDKAIVKAAQQRYFGLTTEKNDVNYVKSFFEKGKEKQLELELRTLNRGEFLYQNKGSTTKCACPKYERKQQQRSPTFSYTFNYAT